MSQGYTALQLDTRNLGAMINRILDDLNRPDLSTQALEYAQDTMRFYQSKPWFFTEQDNSAVNLWQASTIYPQGSLIQVTISGTQYAVCAVTAGTSGSTTPIFPATIFTVPFTTGTAVLFQPPAPGTPGTVVDNNITWATVGLWSSLLWTGLATVYNVNQYVMPFGFQTPQRLEITTANLRLELEWRSYDELRDYDVVQPAPITAYPRLWAWYQQQVYLWPYPNGFFPITVSFRFGPQVLTQPNQSNFWTTTAEAMVRNYTNGRLSLAIIHDPDAASHFMAIAKEEEKKLRSQAIQQRSPSHAGIPAGDW